VISNKEQMWGRRTASGENCEQKMVDVFCGYNIFKNRTIFFNYGENCAKSKKR